MLLGALYVDDLRSRLSTDGLQAGLFTHLSPTERSKIAFFVGFTGGQCPFGATVPKIAQYLSIR